LARAHIKSAHQTLGVVVRGDGRPFAHGRTDNGNVADDRGSGVDADLAGFEVDLLVLALHNSDFQIDNATVAEGRNHFAGFRVQLDEPITGGDIEDALITSAISPVGNSMP